jgi:hypothetical protein
MIKVAKDKLNLVKFAQDAYELSTPQGMGFLHAKAGGLDEGEAQAIVERFKDDNHCALALDYVHGRACKMTVRKGEEGYELPDSWYDHTNAQYSDLLSRHGIEYKTEEKEKKASHYTLGVPAGCDLDPMLIAAISMTNKEHPCDRCNADRSVCKGYARKDS